MKESGLDHLALLVREKAVQELFETSSRLILKRQCVAPF